MRNLMWIGLIFCLTFSGIVGQAQEKIILTLSSPQFYDDIYDRDYFQPFFEVHPNVDVVIVPDTDNQSYTSPPAYTSIEEHLEGITAYVSSADVLFVSSWSISPESTRAGLWLDLMPLVAADPDLTEANFYSAAWRSFHWDRGMWVLPILIEPQMLVYDPLAYDEAGLTYPSSRWTMTEHAQAAITLTQRDADGNPVTPGCWCSPNLMFYGSLGHGLVGADGAPVLEDPELASMLDTWADAVEQIYPQGGYSSENVPLLIMAPWMLAPNSRDAGKYVLGDLPGGIYGANAQGYGISAGTAHPEMAFELVKYLAENPVNTFSTFGTFPALRRSVLETRANFSVDSLDSLPPDKFQILQSAVENGIVASDLLYFDYVQAATSRINNEGLDAMSVLQEAQQQALQNLEVAANWRGTQPVMVATPQPTPSFGADEIVLNFGISLSDLPNSQDWDRVAREFAEADAEVGVLNINAQGMGDYQEWLDENDCFYLHYDPIHPDYWRGDYVALDPLMDVDPGFDANDFLPGMIEDLQIAGHTYGYPLTVGISALGYDADLFQEAGIPLPELNWTINEFVDALAQLKQTDVAIPFSPNPMGDTDWLMLFAAYGGLPIDYRTDPATWNFTDPTTVDAIRQALDLEKTGLSEYHKTGGFMFSGMRLPGGVMGMALNGDVFSTVSPGSSYVNYPQGTGYQVMSLGSIGGGYVRSGTQHIEACYRWITQIAAHPELLPAIMPARFTAINNPATMAVHGETAVAVYRQYAALAADPDTINIPGQFMGSYDLYFVHKFLNRAMDAYVLEDTDLEQALIDAQTKADEFSVCYAAVASPEVDANEEEILAYNKIINNCVAQVDSEMAAESAQF